MEFIKVDGEKVETVEDAGAVGVEGDEEERNLVVDTGAGLSPGNYIRIIVKEVNFILVNVKITVSCTRTRRCSR